MAIIGRPVKLKHGTATKIALRFKVTVQHVSAIAKDGREGRSDLVKAILLAAKRYELEQQKKGKVAAK